MVSFTVLNQLLSNQLILWKEAVMLGVDYVTSEAAVLISMIISPPPPKKKKKLAMICRLFTVPYFSVRLSKSSAYQYGQPSWFHMTKGTGVGVYSGQGREAFSQTLPVPYVRLTSSSV